jgi:hypothetical protein
MAKFVHYVRILICDISYHDVVGHVENFALGGEILRGNWNYPSMEAGVTRRLLVLTEVDRCATNRMNLLIQPWKQSTPIGSRSLMGQTLASD